MRVFPYPPVDSADESAYYSQVSFSLVGRYSFRTVVVWGPPYDLSGW